MRTEVKDVVTRFAGVLLKFGFFSPPERVYSTSPPGGRAQGDEESDGAARHDHLLQARTDRGHSMSHGSGKEINFGTAGEVIFATANTLTHSVFTGLPNMS
jgi:hypothetical protein